MIVSEARREANRRNALRSTGPNTEVGKDRSRRNALKHGLSATVVDLPGEAAATPPAAIDPALDWSGWLVEQVGLTMGKLRRCDRLEAGERERIALGAESGWDDDRAFEAELLGARIGRDPAAIARGLRRSPHGSDWMIDRWSRLARAADEAGSWTPEQTALAFDLLGTPADFRSGSPGGPVDLDSPPVPFDPAALARREIQALRSRKGPLARVDALARSLARAEGLDEHDPALRRLRRHESDLHRRLRWCVARLDKVEDPAPATTPAPPPAPARVPARPEPRPAADGPALLPRIDPLSLPDFLVGPGGTDAERLGRYLGIMERAEARVDAEEAEAEGRRVAYGSALPPRRPDPRLALEKARQADRRRKRDR